jgi:hypothetical protein
VTRSPSSSPRTACGRECEYSVVPVTCPWTVRVVSWEVSLVARRRTNPPGHLPASWLGEGRRRNPMLWVVGETVTRSAPHPYGHAGSRLTARSKSHIDTRQDRAISLSRRLDGKQYVREISDGWSGMRRRCRCCVCSRCVKLAAAGRYTSRRTARSASHTAPEAQARPHRAKAHRQSIFLRREIQRPEDGGRHAHELAVVTIRDRGPYVQGRIVDRHVGQAREKTVGAAARGSRLIQHVRQSLSRRKLIGAPDEQPAGIYDAHLRGVIGE